MANRSAGWIQSRPVESGLKDWLAGYGVKLSKGLVLDPRSGALPIPVERQLGGGMSVREIQLVPYPYIVDVRGEGLDATSPVSSSLGELQVPWSAAIEVDAAQNKARKVTPLLRSSAQSWVSDSTKLLPDFQHSPELGFEPSGERAVRTLAVMLEGRFDSAFKGQPSPLLESARAAAAKAEEEAKVKGEPSKAGAAPGKATPSAGGDSKPLPIGRVIEHSPGSARLIVVASNALFGDAALNLVGQAQGRRATQVTAFAQNLVDWSLEDQGLLGIRSRGEFARTLAPLTRDSEAAWEYGNYGLALFGLFLVWLIQHRRRAAAMTRHALILREV